jgi:hypothetical protein
VISRCNNGELQPAAGRCGLPISTLNQSLCWCIVGKKGTFGNSIPKFTAEHAEDAEELQFTAEDAEDGN